MPLAARVPHAPAVAFGLGLAVGCSGFFGYWLSLSRIVVFLPFFVLGYYADRNWINQIKKIPLPLALAFFIIAYFILKAGLSVPTGLLYGSFSYSALGLGDLSGCLARALLYLAGLTPIMFFFALIPEKETWFTRFGSKTLNVYLLHGFIIIYTKSIGLPACIDSASEHLLLIAAALGLTLALASAPVAFVTDKVINPLKLLKKHV